MIVGERNSCNLFQAPPLPSYFVERPEVSDELKSSLLEKTSITGALVVSAIHGLGGIGKSTLVIALAHDQKIRNRFPDGIFWATLGQQPDVLSLLTSWIQNLGDYKFSPTNIDAASRQLCSLLDNKAVLLVVDDVWNADHALPFRVGGSKCRLLITTRNADIARVIDAALYNLDVMTEEQALTLLEKRIRRKVQNDEQKQAKVLAEAVEYLPLALELAAAQVTDGIPFSELIENLKQEIAKLEVLDLPGFEEESNETIRKKLSLLASFNLSLRRLSAEKLQKFAWLGVVPEDVTLTQKMVTTLWETDLWKARHTLRYLRNKALLLEDIPLADGTPTYRLHDLVHDLSRRLLTSPFEQEQEEDLPGLGLTLQEAHSELLNRYRKCTKDGLWYQLPDDGYIHSYLAWHMEQAGCEEEIHKLLKEETDEGKNGWYQVRESLGQTTGYLADVTRAWKLAEEAFKKHQCPGAIGLQVRYALVTASLNSIADNISPELLGALVKQKIWTVEQGLAYARQKTNLIQKSLALAFIAPNLPELDTRKIFQEALTASKLQRYFYGVKSAHLRLQKIIINGYVEIFANIAPNIPELLLQEALEIIKTFGKNQKLLGMAMLMPYLPALKLKSEMITQKILEAVRELLNQDEETFLKGSKSKTPQNCLFDTELMELAPYLPEQVQQICLEEVQTRLNEIGQEHCFTPWQWKELLSTYLPESQLVEVVFQIQIRLYEPAILILKKN
jgi:GTPase SAR1 family protein